MAKTLSLDDVTVVNQGKFGYSFNLRFKVSEFIPKHYEHIAKALLHKYEDHSSSASYEECSSDNEMRIAIYDIHQAVISVAMIIHLQELGVMERFPK